jgi:hypothetical protein
MPTGAGAQEQELHMPVHKMARPGDPGTDDEYAAAIRLRYPQPDLKRSYRVPGGSVGKWCIAGVGFPVSRFCS